VINAITQAPIPRALVYSPDNRFATLTDGEGHFEFALPKLSSRTSSSSSTASYRARSGIGSFNLPWLQARKPGFLDGPSTRRPQTETAPNADLTIALMPEALIKGRIMLSESDAAFGANVQLFSRQVQEGMPRWVLSGSVQANSDGEFRFAELLPGTYKLGTAELMDNDPAITIPGGPQYGFPPSSYPGVAEYVAAGTIQLAAGQTGQADIPLTRQPYYPVKIPVANAGQNGGLNISVSLLGRRSPGYSLGYSVDKQQIEGLLPKGNYRVEAATFGPNSETGGVNISVAGAPVEGPSLTLVPSSSINVHVVEDFTSTGWGGSGTWSDGTRTFALHGPRLYLNVTVEAADDPDRKTSAYLRPPMGPNDDSLVIESVAPGRYWLKLHSNRGYVASATAGVADLLHAPVLIGSGSTTPIEVNLRDDTAEIEGTVAGITAQPAIIEGTVSTGFSPLAWVYCIPLPDSPGQFQQLGVSPDGKFNSPALAPGTYRVLAFKDARPNLPYRDADSMKAYDTKGEVVHLTAGQKTTVQLQLVSDSE